MPPCKTIGIVGGGGRLGRALACRLAGDGVRAEIYDLPVFDVSSYEAVAAIVDHCHAIVNCAEQRPEPDAPAGEELHRVNAVLPGRLADAAAARGRYLLHVSTAAVFVGVVGRRGATPFFREDAAALGGDHYARTKVNGECAVRAWRGKYAILRLGPLYGDGEGAVDAWLADARAGRALRVRPGGWAAPTPMAAAARAAAALLEARAEGVYHFAASGKADEADVAAEILRGHGGRRLIERLAGAPEYPAGLRCGKIDRHLPFARPAWRRALRLFLDGGGGK